MDNASDTYRKKKEYQEIEKHQQTKNDILQDQFKVR